MCAAPLTPQTHYPGSVRRMWWEQASVKWDDWNGAGRIASAQRRRRGILALLFGLVVWWGMRRTARGIQLGYLVRALLGPIAQRGRTTVDSIVASVRHMRPAIASS